jgi:hypothetical protein
MGIYTQTNRWQCGPFALKHALLVHGILVPESEISRAAGTTWRGTDEAGLRRAARSYDCDLPMVRRLNPDRARRELVGYLRRGIPCLLCIQEWGHWVTVVKEEKGQFILLDSEEPAVLAVAGWTKLKRMWAYHEADEFDEETVHTFFDIHPLLPRGRRRTRARFSLDRARYLRRKSSRDLARLWDVYVDDLLAICRPRVPQSRDVFSLGEFLRRHESMILDQLDYWHGGIERRAAARVLERMHFVADTYGLVILQGDEKRAIAAISIILGLWASAHYGVGPVYDTEASSK